MGGREQGLGTKGDGEAGDAAPSAGRRLHLELPRCLGRSRASGESGCGAPKGSPSPSALGHHHSQEHPGWCLPPRSAPPPRPNRPRIRAPPSSLRAKGDGGLRLGKKGSWWGHGQMSPPGRRQKATRMLLGRENRRVSPGAGGGKVPPAHQRIPRHQGHPRVPKTLPALAKPKHQILAREGHQNQRHGLVLGCSILRPVPRLGSLHRTTTAGKNTVRTRVNVCSSGSQGKNVQQMKMCSAGAFITHQLQDGPFGDESPFSFTKDLSSFV